MTCQSKTTTLSRRDFNRSLATLAAGAMAGGTATAAGKPLDKVRFGKTDLLVTRYSQGTAFREIPRNDNPQTRRVLHRCLDVGINFFDSAEAYSWGESEKLLGRVIGAAATRWSSAPRRLPAWPRPRTPRPTSSSSVNR